jgi:hypothetical protein
MCRLLQVLARNDDRWGECDQQDAQELLQSLLNYLQTDMSDGPPPRLGLRRGSVGLSESHQVLPTPRRCLPSPMQEKFRLLKSMAYPDRQLGHMQGKVCHTGGGGLACGATAAFHRH